MSELKRSKSEISIGVIKQILGPQICKAKVKEYIDIYNNNLISKTKNQKKNNKSFSNQKTNILNNEKIISILDYDFLNKKPKNPEDFFIDENENDTNTQEKRKKPGLYEKFLSMKIIKENRIEEERIRKIQDDFDSLKQPVINQKSLIICRKNKTLSKPIYKRLKEIENKHNEKIIKIKMSMNKEKEEKHRKDKVKRKNLKNYNEHDFNEWLSDIEEWDNCRQEKIRLKRCESASFLNEKDEDCTYHPKINKKSKSIIKKKRYDNSTQVSQRLYNNYFEYQEKKKELEKKYAPTFQPKVNENFFIEKFKTYTYIIEEQQ